MSHPLFLYDDHFNHQWHPGLAVFNVFAYLFNIARMILSKNLFISLRPL